MKSEPILARIVLDIGEVLRRTESSAGAALLLDVITSKKTTRYNPDGTFAVWFDDAEG